MFSRTKVAAKATKGSIVQKEQRLMISGRTEAIASFGQQRIWFHDQLYFHDSDLSVYNIVVPLIIKQGSLSIERVSSALRSVIERYTILRTAVRFNPGNNQIEQYIQPIADDIYLFQHSRGISTVEQLDDLLTAESIRKHFDVENGRVVKCHVVERGDKSHGHLLHENDLIIFTIHHIAFDLTSSKSFVKAFERACWTDAQHRSTLLIQQYIDFAQYEQELLADANPNSQMNKARRFWFDLMQGYDWDRIRSLVPTEIKHDQTRSGRGYSTVFVVDQQVVDAMMMFASSNNITMFSLTFASFYAFLFKLLNNEEDLCVASVVANRFNQETKEMIGMFVNILPYRIQIEPNKSFNHFVRKVQQLSTDILEHASLPYQEIIGLHDKQKHQRLPSTFFQYDSLMSSVTQKSTMELTVDKDSVIGAYYDRDRSRGNGLSTFDMSVTIAHEHHTRTTECVIDCAVEIFQNQAIVNKLATRFQHILRQLFCSSIVGVPIYNQCSISINNLSLILPEEIEEIHNVIFHRLPAIANEAPASYAQARIWLDERIRFDPDKPQVAIYNMPFVYRLQPDHTLSIERLLHALQLIVLKHQSLRTSLVFNAEKNQIMQRIIDLNNDHKQMLSVIESTHETDKQLTEIMHDEKRNPHLFDLAQGLVFRCHIIYYKQISSNHLLSHKDILIFNFHHALFDFPSMKVFHHDLNQAYTTGQLLYDNNTNLRYLDYAVIEQQMPMTGASMFWLDALQDCKLDQPLSLPFDRYRLSNEHRTGRGTSISFDFGQDLSHDFLIHASSNNISLEHLALATYYVFLFKLTNGEKDLCIGINTDDRYRDELGSIIGMFVNAIPLRCQLDPHLSFHKVTKHVQDNMINCMKYSYFPLQHILNQHPNISTPVFLDTSFDFVSSTTKDEKNEIMIGDSRFSLLPYSITISEDEIMSKFDFILSFQHDLNLNKFSCTVNASVDLFNAETICIIAQRLQAMLHQQFTSFNSKTNKPIHELPITLSNEQYLMQSMNNTQISFPSASTCIHHEFVYQVMKHPQKLAVELDEQLLTYCELLYYVQTLSLTLLNEYHISPGEIVCQCVERSLSMVIGIMGIEMAGGVYCPLSPRDPQHRLNALVQQTQSRLVLVHWLTKTEFSDDTLTIDIHSRFANNDVMSDGDVDRLSSITVTPNDIAYIIFTSG
ncbi:unnamed protein product, partial [Adineta steineri]